MPLFFTYRGHRSGRSNSRNADETMSMSKPRIVMLELLGKFEKIQEQREGQIRNQFFTDSKIISRKYQQ